MKLSEEQTNRLLRAERNLTDAICSTERDSAWIIGCIDGLARVCISIGVEIAMQHRHVEHGMGWKTGPAEAINHE